MFLSDWFLDQKLSDWVQGVGSLAAAAAAVGIALRQERFDRHRDDSARVLRRKVLAAALTPVLRDLHTTARLRSALLQTIGRARSDGTAPHGEDLMVPLPDIILGTIERVDVFGAYVAAQVYTLMHRVNDYNRNVHAQREWDVPLRTWSVNLRPKLDAITETLDILIPRMAAEVEGLEHAGDD